jgi:5-methylcytosine-specific restriction endonuclease McrA
MQEQTCKDCGERLPLSRDFFGQYKNVSRHGEVRIGFRSSCRRCMAARTARHATEHPEQKQEAAKRRAARAISSGADVLLVDVELLRRHLGDACRYCGDALSGAGELDHLTPIARGGSGRRGNLTLACTACNRAKLAKTLGEFLAWRLERGLFTREVKVPGETPDEPQSAQQRRNY